MPWSSLAVDCGGTDRLVPIDSAFAIITRAIRAVAGVDRVPLGEAVGRVMAEDAVTQSPLPRFDHSAVDGYAVTAADVSRTAPYRLKVTGRLAAGSPIATSTAGGEALQVFTGAALPPEIAAVVPEERCIVERAAIVIAAPVAEGANIRRLGEDVPHNSVVVEAARSSMPVTSPSLPRPVCPTSWYAVASAWRSCRRAVSFARSASGSNDAPSMTPTVRCSRRSLPGRRSR